ncbi:MAG: M48 family metallopeptidase [Methylophilaceae bacterium]
MPKTSLTLPNGATIHYQLERRPRRTIGLKVTDDGLIVHAPKRIFEFQLHQVLIQKANWIIDKLEARKNNFVPPMQWHDGEMLQFLGNPLSLNIRHNSKNRQSVFNHHTLSIALLETNTHEAVRRKVTQWYKKQALVDFNRRLEIFATKLGVKTPPLSLSNAQSRWGSCSSRGDVRLNWRLLQAPPHIINYVICHELAHLKEMNHSLRFWAVVASLFPDYKKAEKELKALSPQLHRMN